MQQNFAANSQMKSSDSGHMIQMNTTQAQWNTEFNKGPQPFMGYQQEGNFNYPPVSNTMVQKTHHGADQQMEFS